MKVLGKKQIFTTSGMLFVWFLLTGAGLAALDQVPSTTGSLVLPEASAEICPIVGNRKTKIYHLKGDSGYAKDVRNGRVLGALSKCYASAGDAEKAGLHRRGQAKRLAPSTGSAGH